MATDRGTQCILFIVRERPNGFVSDFADFHGLHPSGIRGLASLLSLMRTKEQFFPVNYCHPAVREVVVFLYTTGSTSPSNALSAI